MVSASIWANSWLSLLDKLDIFNKKSRARPYFEKKHVTIQTISFGLLRATVQGSARNPYKIEMNFEAVPDAENEKIEKVLNKTPYFRDQIENRYWSIDLYKQLSLEHVRIMSSDIIRNNISCSCPDKSVPCKHIIAVMYELVSYIEHDPEILFVLSNCRLLQSSKIKNTKSFVVAENVSKNPTEQLMNLLHGFNDFQDDEKKFISQLLSQMIFLKKQSANSKKIKKSHWLYLAFSDAKNEGFDAEILFADAKCSNKIGLKKAYQDHPELVEDFKSKIELVKNKVVAFKECKKSDEKAFVPFEMLQTIYDDFSFLKKKGIRIIPPKSLQQHVKPVLNLQLLARDTLTDDRTNLFKLDSVVDVCWNVSLGKQNIRLEKFRETCKKNSGLLLINDQYFLLNQYVLENFLEDTNDLPSVLNAFDMLQAVLSGELCGFKATVDSKIINLCKLLHEYKPVPIPYNLKATLRPYQERGFAWLIQNLDINFGSILADDMGLGKTLQVIAAVQHLKNEGLVSKNNKVLIVAPTGVLTNWNKEIERFAPDLKATIYHGNNRKLQKDCDVVLTSYGIARSDCEKLNKHAWQLLVIDEAQNIKNDKTIQTKALKAIKANRKIAMSGTPVENRLLEYWSIFDFTNRGYFGNAKQFQQTFASPIEKHKDQKTLQRFKKITQPFILRRLKTDPLIIQDLPDKIENNSYCSLTSQQADLYQKTIDVTFNAIENSDGIERKGLIFALITSLKQICNHPSQFNKEEKAVIDQSGKMLLLETILESIDYMQEKILIFTQFVQMGNILTKLLEEKLSIKVPFLHGGLSRAARDTIVSDFQQGSKFQILIVSLKAGGVGLNLTAANHVIHYDLWWNPAVESQATDRAYRIGQKKNVIVHRLLTTGTLEEEIDVILNRKKELSNLTVGSGEKWVTEMSNAQLKQLVKLRAI